jgi:predicted dehydrogenase
VDGIWILAPHDLAIALEILGAIPPARSALAERVEDEATGLIALLGDDPWVVFEISTRYPEYRREIRLHCRDGVAILNDGYSQHVQVTRNVDLRESKAPAAELRPISAEFPLLRELRTFVEHLAGGPPPRSSAADGALIVSAVAELRQLAGLDRMRAAAG